MFVMNRFAQALLLFVCDLGHLLGYVLWAWPGLQIVAEHQTLYLHLIHSRFVNDLGATPLTEAVKTWAHLAFVSPGAPLTGVCPLGLAWFADRSRASNPFLPLVSTASRGNHSLHLLGGSCGAISTCLLSLNDHPHL